MAASTCSGGRCNSVASSCTSVSRPAADAGAAPTGTSSTASVVARRTPRRKPVRRSTRCSLMDASPAVHFEPDVAAVDKGGSATSD